MAYKYENGKRYDSNGNDITWWLASGHGNGKFKNAGDEIGAEIDAYNDNREKEIHNEHQEKLENETKNFLKQNNLL